MAARLLFVPLALLVVVAGCAGGAPAGPSTGASAGPTTGPTTAAPTDGELTIVLNDGHGGLRTWRLRCDPPGGDHPDPAAACRALADHGARALPPVAEDRACTQIYGGAQTAQVSGTWRGTVVNSRFSLINGCEIARWKALVGLLPPAGA